MSTTFTSITQMIQWSDQKGVNYLGNDNNAPYVWKGEMYHYFSLQNGTYTLFATSERDLNQEEKK